jgi:hypothetical protein
MARRMVAQSLIDKSKKLSNSLWTDDKGNIEVGKDLIVDGYMQQNSWEFDSDMPDVALSTDMTTAGFSIYYKHSRVSNGKLNIVICVKANNVASLTNQYFSLGTLTLPTDVMSKLYPDDVGSQKVITSQTLMASKISADGTLAGAGIESPMNLCIYKLTNSIRFNGNYTTSAYTGIVYWRFEFNFILS